MHQTQSIQAKNKAKPPVPLTSYALSSVRGPLPANWYIAHMVILNPPESVKKHPKAK
jgi:hypothetical protein